MDDATDVGVWKKVRKNQKIEGGRDYQYSWDLNDAGSGFIVYKRKRNRYRMYEDTNSNGIRDKIDSLISNGKFSDEFRPRDLPFKKDGVITAKAFDADKFQSQSLEMHGHQHEVTGINTLGIEHMSLLDSSGVQALHCHGDAHSHISSMSDMSTMSDMSMM